MLVRREDFGDINKLTKGSSKKIWFVCDWCGVGTLRTYKTYLKTELDLCVSCQKKEISSRPEVKYKQSEATKERWKNPKYRETVSKKVSEIKTEWWKNKTKQEKIPSNKRNYNEIINLVERYGYLLVTNRDKWENDNYVNIIVKCPIHSLETFKFRKDSGCPFCAGRKIYVHDILIECNKLNYKLVNVNGKHIEFICDKGHNNKVTYVNWKQGTRCKYCSGWKNHVDSIYNELESYGFSPIEKHTNINSKTNIKLKCKHCGNIVNESLLSIKNKTRKCENCYKLYLIRNKPLKERYYYLVRHYTLISIKNYSYLFNKKNIKLSWNMTLDHRYSISEGLKNGILPQIVGSPINLQILTRSENCSKSYKCDINIEELFKKYDDFIKDNKNYIN